MLVDWFTVVAQALNFLALVWLLNRFLYKPVMQAVDAREERLAAQAKEMETKRTEAQSAREDLQRSKEELEQHREELLRKAALEAEAQRKSLLDAARDEAGALRKRLVLQAEQEHDSREMAGRRQEEVLAIARQALADLANVTLEERMVEALARKLRGFTAEQKEPFVAFFRGTRDPVVVRSAFELAMPQREVLENTVKEAFAPGARLRFETAPGLIGGIEFVANGQKVAWSVADFLNSLAKTAETALEEAGNGRS